MERGLRQKGGGSLGGSTIVASSGGSCVGFMAKRSWVGEQGKHMEGLEQRDECLDIRNRFPYTSSLAACIRTP